MNQFDRALYFYKDSGPTILASPKNEWAIDPYAWKTLIYMTPIEEMFWEIIRDTNIVLYPQYPVGRFFVDFANPVARVAVECDGKAFHQDKAKDAARDEEIRDMGWHIYRLTGRECFEWDRETEDDEGTQHLEISNAKKFAIDLGKNYGIARGSRSMEPAGESIYRLLDHLIAVNTEAP